MHSTVLFLAVLVIGSAALVNQSEAQGIGSGRSAGYMPDATTAKTTPPTCGARQHWGTSAPGVAETCVDDNFGGTASGGMGDMGRVIVGNLDISHLTFSGRSTAVETLLFLLNSPIGPDQKMSCGLSLNGVQIARNNTVDTIVRGQGINDRLPVIQMLVPPNSSWIASCDSAVAGNGPSSLTVLGDSHLTTTVQQVGTYTDNYCNIGASSYSTGFYSLSRTSFYTLGPGCEYAYTFVSLGRQFVSATATGSSCWGKVSIPVNPCGKTPCV
jgi:hypothetical protein